MKPLAAIAMAGAVFVLTGCAKEPPDGCMLAAINERAVLRAKNYLQPNVEAHLLAIWFQNSRHVALVVKGDHRWFAWDDVYGGRPLFLDGPPRLPDAFAAAQAAFPRKTVEMAWWIDEPEVTRPASREMPQTANAGKVPTVAAHAPIRRGQHRTFAGRRPVTHRRKAGEREHRGHRRSRAQVQGEKS